MGVSRRAADLVMGLVSAALVAGFTSGNATITPTQEDILAQIPPTIESALGRFKLDCKTVTYAVCPTCHCNYKPSFASGSTTPQYPAFCDNIPEPGQTCGERLLHDTDGNGCAKPLKTYVYHSFHDFLAGLLSRPDLELEMNKASDDFMRSAQEPPPPYVADIFEAEYLKTFEGPRAGELFLDRGEEGRYGFSLFVDFFIVGGLRVRGPKASCGIIAMACLNLPIHLRFKPENIYLAGLVPGPHEPHLTQLNHYLRPLIADMADSWNRGIHYSRTATKEEGCDTHSAIVTSVNDLPGGRKVSALAGATALISCTICECHHKDGRYDYEEWKKKDVNEMRQKAEMWKNASTVKEQEEIWKKSGTRWSEMWNLPYWDPTRQLVIDAMHCLLEGLIHTHFRHILRLSNLAADSKPTLIPALHISETWPKSALKGRDLVQLPTIISLLEGSLRGDNPSEVEESIVALRTTLTKKRKSPLVFVVAQLDLIPEKSPRGKTTRPQLADALIAWVSAAFYLNDPFTTDECLQRRKQTLQVPQKDPMEVTSPEVMQKIRNVIAHTTTPSWVNSVPSNFGEASAGSIKADEWRTLGTIYFPLVLTSLWGEGSVHKSPERAAKLRSVLDLTMSLVSAVTVACKRTVTKERQETYRNQIAKYTQGLSKLYPAFDHRPNNHVAFHIYDFLTLFGPVHSWWTFPFERLIGQLQRMPSNHKFGTRAFTSCFSRS